MYIEELAELISVNIPDVNSLSVKPDKCAILQETVNQIRKIREHEDDERTSTSSSGSSSCGSSHGNRTTSPGASMDETGALVHQQGDATCSGKPALLDTQLLGTFLLEALDGFLFVVNTEGKTEYVSDNVAHFLHYRPSDLVGKSIYNFIHHGDHARFSSSLLPTAIGMTTFSTFLYSTFQTATHNPIDPLKRPPPLKKKRGREKIAKTPHCADVTPMSTHKCYRSFLASRRGRRCYKKSWPNLWLRLLLVFVVFFVGVLQAKRTR